MTRGGDAPDSPVQQVVIERRGGFAGLHLSVSHEYASLTVVQRRTLDELASRPTSAAPVAGGPTGPVGADRFTYRLQLTHADGRQRKVDVAEAAWPASLAGLVQPTRA